MATSDAATWLPSNAHRESSIRLLCFPHAGGGTAMFHRWARRLKPSINVVPIKLPGREDRSREPAVSDLRILVDQLHHALEEFAAAAPLALFGHSMGGLISYEWAQRLRQDGVDVRHVFVSACRPPSEFRRPAEPLHTLSDVEMITRLNQKYGTGQATTKGEMDLMMFMAQTIRADLTLLETYEHPSQHEPLSCPLTILGGADDAPLSRVVLQGWQKLAPTEFKLRIFPGHHFYIREQEEAVTKFVRARLSIT